MKDKKQSREEQRQLILESAIFHSGKLFNHRDASPLIGGGSSKAAHLLAAMAKDKLLGRTEIEGEGKLAGRRVVAYHKPVRTPLNRTWRKRTNEMLGIEAAGVCGR